MTDLKHPTLAVALAAFQAELPPLTKDARAKVKGVTKDGKPYDKSYDYSGLDQFVEIVEPVLGNHGLSITSKTTIDAQGNFMLEVSLLHESGERETSYWPLPDPRRVGPQDLGSAMTYGRRYLGWGLTGTFPGGQDDDGATAQQSNRESWDNAQPRQQQVQSVPVGAPVAPPAAPKVWTDEEIATFHTRLADRTVDLDTTGKGYDWLASRGLHEREINGKTATAVLADRLASEALDGTSTLAHVKKIQAFANGRGLYKVNVSETETLANALFEAAELAKHAADAEGSQDPQGVADAAVIGQSHVPGDDPA